MRRQIIALATCLVFAGLTVLVTGTKTNAQASNIKDASYCRAAGDWAAAEVSRRIEDSDRRILDAVEDFGPIQLAERGYYVFILEFIYENEIKIFPEGMEDMANQIYDLHRKSAREFAETICVEEFIG